MRILFVSDEYPPVVGGAARNIALLCGQLAQRGHQVAVATAWQPDCPAEELDGAVRVLRVRDLSSRARRLSDDPNRHHAPPFPDPETILRLRGIVADFEPDLVDAYGWMAASAAAAVGASGTPLLLSVHDYGNVCALFTLVRDGAACSGPAPAKCLACATSNYGAVKASVAVASIFGSKRLLRRRVKAIRSVSRFTAEMTDRNMGVPGVAPVVVPNFLEPNGDQLADPATLDQIPDQPFILFVGHLRAYKGLHVLLSAYEQMERPPPLVLVGTIGPDTPERFPEGITVLTYLPHATVMALWERSLFGVSPSIAPEALPSVVLEAMSRGKATVASRIGGYGDLIEDGESGLLVPPGSPQELASAMTRLTDDADLRARLGRAAAERAKRFSPEAILPEIERLYRETVADAERV